MPEELEGPQNAQKFYELAQVEPSGAALNQVVRMIDNGWSPERVVSDLTASTEVATNAAFVLSEVASRRLASSIHEVGLAAFRPEPKIRHYALEVLIRQPGSCARDRWIVYLTEDPIQLIAEQASAEVATWTRRRRAVAQQLVRSHREGST